jgi:Zn-dependent metalloprotease
MRHCTFCSIIPPYLLRILAEDKDPQIRERAKATLDATARARTIRATLSGAMRPAALAAAGAGAIPSRKIRRIFSCEGTSDLSRKLIMQEGDQPPANDVAVQEAYNYAGVTWDFYNKVFGRNSIDNAGLTMVSSVHYSENGQGFDNALWNGHQMIYGDGGEEFGRMTKCPDVVAHELTHGVTQYTAGLAYQGQSGALNESMSDVFGVVVRQWHQQQTNPAEPQTDPSKANWLVGDGLLRTGGALRSMAKPGTAFPGDPQPAHMKDYQTLPNTARGDFGGVHINSGIPNHAFYLAAVAIGKPAWETAAKIWYLTLTERLKGNSDFQDCAQETISVAGTSFDASTAQKVKQAWIDVGILTKAGAPAAALRPKAVKPSARGKTRTRTPARTPTKTPTKARAKTKKKPAAAAHARRGPAKKTGRRPRRGRR